MLSRILRPCVSSPRSPERRQSDQPAPKKETLDQRLLRWFPAVVRYSGLLLGFHQVLIEKADRPGALALAGSMMAGSFVVEAIVRPRTTDPAQGPAELPPENGA